MKDQILMILQMQAEGKLTQDQAAELLAALADSSPTPPLGAEEKATVGKTGGAGAPGARGPAATFNRVVESVAGVGAQVGRAAGVLGNEVLRMIHNGEDGNSVTLSKVAPPAGEEFSFQNNVINVSTLTGVELVRAEMSNNSINASKLARISVKDGKFSQCEVSGSSFDEVRVEKVGGGASIRAVSFIGSKCVRMEVAGVFDGCSVHSSSLKDFCVKEGGEVRDVLFSGSAVNLLTVENGMMKGGKVEHSAVTDLTLRGTTFEGVVVSGCKVGATLFVDCVLKDVTLRRELARNNVLEDSRFERCKLSGCEFVGCTFKGTVLRDVELVGVVVRGVDFSGMVVEGTEGFRRVAGT